VLTCADVALVGQHDQATGRVSRLAEPLQDQDERLTDPHRWEPWPRTLWPPREVLDVEGSFPKFAALRQPRGQAQLSGLALPMAWLYRSRGPRLW
jgi:hypothetical protein